MNFITILTDDSSCDVKCLTMVKNRYHDVTVVTGESGEFSPNAHKHTEYNKLYQY